MKFIDASAVIGRDVKIGLFSVIEAGVVLGDGVAVGHHVTIHPGTRVGDATTVGDHAVLGKQATPSRTSTVPKADLPPLVIGSSCIIGTGAVLFAGTVIGSHSMVADQAFVRERCRIGEYVLVGRGVCLENQVSVGAYTKIQTGAYITAYSTLEDHVFIAPMVTTTNDNFMGRTRERLARVKGPTIRRGARVGGGAILLPGITIGAEAFIAAGALVTRDVEPRQVCMGVPARALRRVPAGELLKDEGREQP